MPYKHLDRHKKPSEILINHGKRVGILAYAMGHYLSIDEEGQDLLYIAGRWHDVGKDIMPDSLLHNKKKLSMDEVHQLKMHPIYSFQKCKEIGLPPAVCYGVLHHHENMDGSGYPTQMIGEKIPFISRVIRVCDAFDAMLEDRPYRPGLEIEEAMLEMYSDNEKGLFDKEIFKVFADNYREVEDYVKGNLFHGTRHIDWTNSDFPVLKQNGHTRPTTSKNCVRIQAGNQHGGKDIQRHGCVRDQRRQV